jgi:peptidoglycan hydrolase CwlO-like protein
VLLAVPINSATVMFTMNAFDPLIRSMADSFGLQDHFSTLKIAVFLVLQFVVYLIVTFVSLAIPDHVHDLKVNKDRTAQVISNLALIEQLEQEEGKITKLQNTIQDNKNNIAKMGKEISTLKDKVKSLSDENKSLKAHREE